MDLTSIQGVPPAVVVACAALAVWGGWPYLVLYLPQIKLLLTSLLQVPGPSPQRTTAPRWSEPAQPAVELVSEPGVPEAVVHLVALESALDAAGVPAAERGKLVDPIWPRIVRGPKNKTAGPAET